MEFNVIGREYELETSIFSRDDNASKDSQILSFSRVNLAPPVLYLSNVNNESGTMQMGVFTQSQWMELEHQALIYKYLTANEPIPSSLLLPIKKAVEASRLSYFPSLLARPASYNFCLNYGGNGDLEPGRCRRTDGKKWRCSQDAVAEQKYCERHMNRGRHRSRKPVEEQPMARGSSSKKEATWHQGSGEYVWGPLGEVMKGGGACKSLAPLNLIGDGLESSPPPVLAKTNFNYAATGPSKAL